MPEGFAQQNLYINLLYISFGLGVVLIENCWYIKYMNNCQIFI